MSILNATRFNDSVSEELKIESLIQATLIQATLIQATRLQPYLVEGMGGAMSFESQEGVGTTFFIDFPVIETSREGSNKL